MDAYVRHSLLMAVLFSLAAAGCRGPDPSIELLESELRWMEDEFYDMDRQLGLHCAQLQSCRQNNAALRQQIAQLERGSASPESGQPQLADPGTDRRSVAPAPTPTYEEPDLTIPEIEYGPPSDEADSELDEKDSLDSATPPRETRVPARDDVTQHVPEDVNVSRIVLNSRLTGGIDLDGQPGDDGLLVVIEPQNAAGDYLAMPGDVSIDVIDPSQSGINGRIARWDFDATETTTRMKETLLGQGIHLKLPWPDDRPASARLKVLVRYCSIAGQAHQVEREIRLNRPARQLPTPPIAAKAPSASSDADPWSATREPTLAQSLLADGTLEPPSAPVELEEATGPSPTVANAARPRTAPRRTITGRTRPQRIAYPAHPPGDLIASVCRGNMSRSRRRCFRVERATKRHGAALRAGTRPPSPPTTRR